jgi:hypothetical protein
MPDIGNYTVTTELVLAEAGKYVALIAYAPVAYRLNDFLLARWPGEKITEVSTQGEQ